MFYKTMFTNLCLIIVLFEHPYYMYPMLCIMLMFTILHNSCCDMQHWYIILCFYSGGAEFESGRNCCKL